MQKRWISLLLVLALVLAVWSVCAVAADAQKADEAAGEEAAAEPAAEEPAEEDTPAEEPAAPAEEADTASEAEEPHPRRKPRGQLRRAVLCAADRDRRKAGIRLLLSDG